MKHLLRFLLCICSTLVVCQECTSYVLVKAFDKKEQVPVSLLNFSPEDFDARLDKGQIIPVVSIKPVERNRILFLLDISGSNKGRDDSSIVKGIVALAKQAPEGQPIAFGVFAEKALFTSAFFPSGQQRNASIDEVMSHAGSLGKTPAFYDALHEALTQFGQHQAGDTIFLIAADLNYKSKHSYEDLEREFSAQGTRLLIATGPGLLSAIPMFTTMPLIFAGRSEGALLANLSAETGGGAVVMNGLGWPNITSSGYLVGINLPPDMDKPKSWKLKLRDSTKTHSNPTLLYPQHLAPCNSK